MVVDDGHVERGRFEDGDAAEDGETAGDGDAALKAVLCVATGGADATRSLGAAMAALLGDGDLVVLAGDLGAGKTCLAQGVGRGLGIDDRITSPTFTLANRYRGSLVLNHLDVYRIDQLADTLDLDLPELLESGVTLIEWGERIDPVLPADHLVLRITFGEAEDDRSIVFEASGPAWRERIGRMRKPLAAWTVPC